MRDQKTYAVIGAAMEVHKELGSGFLEAVYQKALWGEFREPGIPFKSQPTVQILYKGRALSKKYQPDFICFDEIIVEIKAIANLSGVEHAQIINYLNTNKLFKFSNLKNLRKSAQSAD